MVHSILLSFLLLFLSVFGLVNGGPTPSPSSVEYFVLIDGGSTGSRAHVHQYTRQPGQPIPVVEESKNMKIKPGLSSYAKNPSDVGKSVQELLSFIRTQVPESHWSRTPIHLMATAGLRSVTTVEADAILHVVRNDLSASGFRFERHWARIISGEQEGINGWMAVNYLLGVFHQPAGSVAPPSTGVVEMGGSSMQITFAPQSPSMEERKQLSEIKIAGHTYWLYTHSFLQYGLQAAQTLYQKLAMNEIEENGNPCYPREYRHSSIGDFDRCTQLLNVVVDKSIKCASVSCSFNGIYQPKIQEEQFLAIENFYYTAKFFGTAQQQDATVPTEQNSAGAPPTGNQVTSGLRAKGKEFCNKPWSSLLEEHRDKTPIEELSTFCFSAAYQSVILESGLGFHSETNLRVAKTINKKGIDWEIGATLLELMKETDETDAKKSVDQSNTNEEFRIIDPMDSGLPITVVRTKPHSNQVGSNSLYCASCILYTALFALAVIVTYAGWTRYSKRLGNSGPSMTSYSQSAFNRV